MTVHIHIGAANSAGETPQLDTAYDWNVNAPTMTAWTRFCTGNIVAQISGTATGVTAFVQRSDVDPANATYYNTAAPNAVNADTTGFTALGTAGYYEYGIGWWRWNITSVTGGVVNASLSGITS